MIEISESNKILILILLVGFVIFLLSGSNKKSEPIHNEGSLQQSSTTSKNVDTDSLPNNTDNSSSDSSASSESLANNIISSEYKTINYADGNRNQAANLDTFSQMKTH